MPRPLDGTLQTRRQMLTVIATTLGSAVASPLEARTAAVGLVKEVQASAFLQRSGSREAATTGGDVFLKDVALTGDQPSRLELRLGTATRLRLGANASLAIERFVAGSAATLNLESGAAYIERDHGGEPNFQLRTPYALLAARGTTFFAGPSKGVFGVFVREGMVMVRSRAGVVTLKAGEGTDFAAPGAAPTPVKRWAQARIDAALASVN